MMKIIFVFIFSIYTVYADECADLKNQFDQQVESAKSLIQSPITLNNIPPSPRAEFTCMGSPKETQRDTNQSVQASMYNSRINNSELVAFHGFERFKNSADACGFSEDLFKVMRDIANRMTIKANLYAESIRSEGSYHQYLGAIGAVIESARLLESVGGDRSERAYQLAGDMYIELADYSVEQLRTNHDFRYDLTVVTGFLRDAIALGRTADIEQYVKKYENVLKFDVNIDGNSVLSYDDFEIKYKSKMIDPKLSASFNYEWKEFDWNPSPMWQILNAKLITEDGSGKLVGNPEFQNPVKLDIRACDIVPVVWVKFKEFGPQTEMWKICDDEGTCQVFPFPTTLKSVAHHALKNWYRTEILRGDGPWYSFNMPLQNLQSEIGNRNYPGEFSQDGMEFTAEYSIKVEHKP